MSEFNQSQRIIRILELFSMGRKLTCKGLYEHFERKASLRTIQRDLLTIQEAGIPLISEKNFSKDNIWSFPREYRQMVLPSIQQNELLALYVLKAYLKTFRGTQIESNLENLLDKIENMAPGDIYLELNTDTDAGILWNQNYGDFNYQIYDEILQNIVSFIVNKKWAVVTYQRPQSPEKSFEIFIHRLFVYNGVIYLAASSAKYNNYMALALQRVKKIKTAKSQNHKPIEFDLEKFRSERFAVFSGAIEHIKLFINSEAAFYFTNRQWHPTQKILVNDDGSLMLEMDVPLSYELVGWIVGWHSYIKALSPPALIESIKSHLKTTLELYEEGNS